MNIRLNISEETFKKYLLKMGYHYKILQYDDFISAIRRNIVKDIQKGIKTNTLKEKLEFIFKDISFPSILLLEDQDIISKISSEYLKKLLDNSSLSLFLEEFFIKFTVEQKLLAYKIGLIRDIKFYNRSMRNIFLKRYLPEVNENNGKYLKAINYLEEYNSDLYQSQKDEIYNEIISHYKESLINEKGLFKSNFIALKRAKLIELDSSIFNARVLRKYVANNILNDNILDNFEYINVKYSEDKKASENFEKIQEAMGTLNGFSKKERERIVLSIINNDTKINNNVELIYDNEIKALKHILLDYKTPKLNSLKITVNINGKMHFFTMKDVKEYIEKEANNEF